MVYDSSFLFIEITLAYNTRFGRAVHRIPDRSAQTSTVWGSVVYSWRGEARMKDEKLDKQLKGLPEGSGDLS